jgi:hypothetical protein
MLNRDFKEFAELLAAKGVEYLVVGGYALAVHGRPRYTGDLDLWVANTDANVARLLEALAAFGFGSLQLKAADFAPDDAVVQLGYPPGRIDLLTGIDGVRFADCYPRRNMVGVSGVELPVIHLDDFKANKRAAARPRDLADLASLDDATPD